MSKNALKDLLGKIDGFLSLEPEEIEKGKELGGEISKIAEKIKPLVSEPELKEKYLKITALIKKYSSKLSKDILTSKKSSLGLDWRKIARKDLSKLKDQVISLQKFLKTHEDHLRKNLFKSSSEIGIRELAVQLEKIDSMDSIVIQRLLKLTDNMSSDLLKKNSKDFEDRIKRIKDWVLMLKEVENVRD